MNVEASLFHPSPWYVEQVYKEGPGKDSVFRVFNHEDREKAPPFILTELSKGNMARLPRKVNYAAAQIQTGFFPVAFDNLPIHELMCPLPKSLLPSLPELPCSIWARCSKLSDTRSGARSSSSLQITSQLLTALTATGVFICLCFYVFCCSSWLKGSVTHRWPFPS